MKLSRLIMVAAIILGTASLAVADNPPSWRGSAGTTFQQWTFSTLDGSAVPESVSNPYGTPTAAITPDEVIATGYWDSFPEIGGSAQGWWDIGTGSITLNIPNSSNTSPSTSTDVQVWVKYWVAPSAAPDVQVSPTATFVSKDTALCEEVPPMGSWYADTWAFHMAPNSDSQTITLVGNQFWGSQIDEIVVDTKTSVVPEPSSLIALFSGVLGMAGVVVRRRRSNV